MTHTQKLEGSEGNKYKLKKKIVWGTFALALLGLQFLNDLVCEEKSILGSVCIPHL